MKILKLLFILLLIPMFVKAWTPDKTTHLLAGSTISMSSAIIAQQFTQKKWVVVGVSVATPALISAGKEIIWDKWMKKGTPEWKDFGATMIGVGITVPLNVLLK